MTSVPSCGERLLRKLMPRLHWVFIESTHSSGVIYVDIGVSETRYWYLAYNLDLRGFVGPGYSLRQARGEPTGTMFETALPKSLKAALIKYMPDDFKAQCIAASIRAATR